MYSLTYYIVVVREHGTPATGWDFPDDFFPFETQRKYSALRIMRKAIRQGAKGVRVDRRIVTAKGDTGQRVPIAATE